MGYNTKKSLSYFFVVMILCGSSFLFMPRLALATTAEEIQTQIQTLLAQIKQLQQQLTQTQGGEKQWCHDFYQSLRIGDEGDEVNSLQTVLEKEGFDINDNEQKGGAEFGESTAAAVSGFQQKYFKEILASAGLTYGNGFVGKFTRVQLNRLYGCNGIKPEPIPVPIPQNPQPVPPGSGSAYTSITLLSPNGGEQWIAGKTYSIEWTYKGSSDRKLRIELYDTNYPENGEPNPILLIANYIYFDNQMASLAGRGAYNWTIPSHINPKSTYKIVISKAGETGKYDESDAPFTIAAETVYPLPGRPTISEQTKCVFSGSTSEQKCYPAVESSSSYYGQGCSGVETCTANVRGEKGDKLTWKSSCGGYAYTTVDGINEYAEFKCPTIHTLLTVLSPNGEEAYKQGDKILVTWKMAEDIWSIQVLKSGSPIAKLDFSQGQANTSWYIDPAVFASGNDYKIRVNGKINYDESDAPFSITAGISTVPTISSFSVSPNAVTSQETVSFSWTTLGVATLQLTLSCPAGVSTPYSIFGRCNYTESFSPSVVGAGIQILNSTASNQTVEAKLVVYDAAGGFIASKTTNVTIYPANVATAPLAPSSLAATVIGNSVNLYWKYNAKDDLKFIIYRRTQTPNGSWAWGAIADLPANATSYKDSSLTAGTYDYHIVACTSLCSAGSNVVTITISGATQSTSADSSIASVLTAIKSVLDKLQLELKTLKQ